MKIERGYPLTWMLVVGVLLVLVSGGSVRAAEKPKEEQPVTVKPAATAKKANEKEPAATVVFEPIPSVTATAAPIFQQVPGAPTPVAGDQSPTEWFLEWRYRVNDADVRGNQNRSFLHEGVNHIFEHTLQMKRKVWGFRNLEVMGLYRYTDDPRVDPEVNSFQRGFLKLSGPTFEVNFGDYLTNYSRFSFNQNTKGINAWKQFEGGLKVTGTAGVFTDRWGSIFRGFEKFADPRRPVDPKFPSKPFTRMVLGLRAEQRVGESSFYAVNYVKGSDIVRSLPREAQLRPLTNDVISVDTSLRIGQDFQFVGEIALSFTEFDKRIQPDKEHNYAGRFEVSHRWKRVSWRVDYARFLPNFFAVNARQVQDLQDFAARGSVDVTPDVVLNFSFRHTNDSLPGTAVVVQPFGAIDPVVLTNIGRTRQVDDTLEVFRTIVDENGNPLKTTVRTPEVRATFRRLPPGKTMQINLGYRERRFETSNRNSFRLDATTGDPVLNPVTGNPIPLFRKRVTRIPFIDFEWALQSTILGVQYEYRQNRDRVISSNSTFTNRIVGSFRGSYFWGNWIVSPSFRFETEPESRQIDRTPQDIFVPANVFDFTARDQTRSYQASISVDFPKYFVLEIFYRELNAELLSPFTQTVIDPATGAAVTARVFGNGGFDRPSARASFTYKIGNSEDRQVIVSFERAVNTFLIPDLTQPDLRSFRENVVQVEFLMRWRR